VLASLPRLVHLRRASTVPGHDRIASLLEFALAESRERRSGAKCVLLRLSEVLFVEAVRQYLEDFCQQERPHMVERAVHPSRDEAAEYYFNYIDLVAAGDICDILAQQRAETIAWLRSVPPERARHRYGPDKWSVSGVVAHLNDCERLFAFRAFWFARGFESPLPSFSQDVAARHDGADERPWDSHIEEFAAVRESDLAALFALACRCLGPARHRQRQPVQRPRAGFRDR
jgi:hypothetical protein